MSAITFRLPVVTFGIIALMFSCKQKSANPVVGQTDTVYVQQLISRGKKIQNAHIDSLPVIANSLIRIGQTDSNKTAIVYGELFNAHYLWQSSKHEPSMEMAVKCLSDIKRWNINQAYPEIYSLIANLHKENTNYKMAFNAQQQGLDWARLNKDTAEIISLLSLRAMLIHSHRKFFHDTVSRDTSINLQMAALNIALSGSRFEKKRIPLYDNTGQYYLDNHQYDKAIEYTNKGVALAQKYDQQRSLTYGYSWLGMAWFYKGERDKGLEYLNSALNIARGLKEPYRVMEIYEHLYDCYYSAGDYKTALRMIRRSQKMRDSLQVRVNEGKMSELQIKYETAEKDKAIALMDKQQAVKNRQLIVVVAGCVLFIVFSIILFLQYRIIRNDNRLTVMSNAQKDKALENIAFIQAHELRRPLASIMGLINVIKASDDHIDKECLAKLEDAGAELDNAIRSIIVHVEEEAKVNDTY
ncbi:hypothetical protein [Mucilaginibacter segetis]|uniref:histidine kinase n=1 Tax=Mucilaginibacter segetis TaxID=2793071 RepID=A0A934PWP8_9SPHI|nr:hypothetical protein [Mucilaginibacter segetis]MBK0381072.1 hypothetical protein [Mucilaginibacter segetis]